MPTNVPANEFLNLEGEKLSTSKNWAIWLHEYLEDFKGYEDALRYTLCATLPENKDTDFTWSEFQARNNNELVAIYGNFINRVIILINKYWGGKVPAAKNLDDYDKDVLKTLFLFPNKIGSYIENFQFKKALEELINLARLGNKYLADKEPWKLKGVNDSIEDAQQLIQFCQKTPSKVNLIEYNKITGAPYDKSDSKNTRLFIALLEKHNVLVKLRRSRGEDIGAACGQLVTQKK